MGLIAALGVQVPGASAQVTPNVVISEIHYHPQPVGTAFPNYDDRADTEQMSVRLASGYPPRQEYRPGPQ